MTLGEMRNYVVATLGLQDIAAYNETDMVTLWLNRGVIDLLSRTRCVVRCTHLTTIAGEDEYMLDHSIMALVDVDNGQTRKRRRDEIDVPGFTLIRADVLRIVPAPSEAGEIQIWGVARPNPMTDPADNLGNDSFGGIPDEWQDAVILYALWHCADYDDDSSSGTGEKYRAQYEGQDGRGGRLQEIRREVNKRGTARLPYMRQNVRQLSPRKVNWVG